MNMLCDFTVKDGLKKSLSKLSASKIKCILYCFKFNLKIRFNLNTLSTEIEKISVLCFIDNVSSDNNVGTNLDKNI